VRRDRSVEIQSLEVLKPLSTIPIHMNWGRLHEYKSSEDNYHEDYRVDISNNERLEQILEASEGKIEMHGDMATRYMPECSGKSAVPTFFIMMYSQFLYPRYVVTTGTNGILFARPPGTVMAPDMNLFSRKERPIPAYNKGFMMAEGHPAPNWCMEVEFESEANMNGRGFHKVSQLFQCYGANGTQIQEIWLMVYPKQDESVIVVPETHNPLPCTSFVQERPPLGSRYMAIFVRNLDFHTTGMHYANDPDRPLLVGYYMLEPNTVFIVPSWSLLYGVPNIETNNLLVEMRYQLN
jgi:hypothetical protein